MSLIFVGSTVRHKGSSQRMEVVRISGHFATCSYQAGASRHRRVFRSDELEPVPTRATTTTDESEEP